MWGRQGYNPVLKKKPYPTNMAGDSFVNPAGAKVFSTIDKSHTYHQTELDEKAKELVTINEKRVLLQYNRLIYGIHPASGK